MRNISSNVVLDPDRLHREVEWLGNEGQWVYDVESIPSSPEADDRGVPSHNQVTWIGFAAKGRTIQIPMGHPIGSRVVGETKVTKTDKHGQLRTTKAGIPMLFRAPLYEKPPPQMTRAEVFPELNRLFADTSQTSGAHGATFDNASVAKYRGGRIPAGKLACTLVMRWLTDENRKRYGLKYITRDIYNFSYDDEEVGRQVEVHPFNRVQHYLHCDVKYTWLEFLANMKRIQEQGLEGLFELETELVSVLSHMRTVGVRIDAERLEQLREELSVKVEEIERTVYAAAGRKFNINAPAQKQSLLWGPKAEGGQGLKPWKMTDTARKRGLAKGGPVNPKDYSTDEESLDSFRGNPLVDALLDYQEHNKVLSTYVCGYLGIEGEKDKPSRIFGGKIYPDFVAYGAATGRFSCVSADSLIEAPRDMSKHPDGIPISKIKADDWVYAFDHERQLVLRKVKWCAQTGTKQTLIVTLENSEGHRRVLRLTPEHLVMLRNGDWRPAANLLKAPTELTRALPRQVMAMVRRNIDGGYIKFFPNAQAKGNGSKGGGSNREHRWIMSQILGRNLSTKYDVDHIDGNKLNNHPDNLRYVPSIEHRGNKTEFAWGTVQPEAPEIYSGKLDYRCVSVEQGPVEPVWDMEVEDVHNFIANGICVHNCRAPNLQNVPRPGTDLGTLVRGLFIADPGWKLIVADYGQVELVILADLAYKETGKKGALWQGFHDGVDPHTMTAAMVLGKRPFKSKEPGDGGVTSDERQRFGKSLNFAVVYGAGPGKVASMAGIKVQEARDLLQEYDRQFPEVGLLRKSTLREARRHSVARTGFPPHSTTLLGRMRRLPSLNSADDGLRMYAERQIFNSRVQGSSADLTKMAMVRFHKKRQPNWQQLLTVHDEIVATSPDGEVEECKAALLDAMAGPEMQALLTVPLSVDVAVVDRWSAAK